MHRYPFSPARRAWVLGGSALAGLSAAGCCTVPPVPQIAGGCSPMPTPFLAGAEVQAAWAGRERYFDAHTHFFNARDVPVAAFLAKSVAHGIASEPLRQLLIALAPVAEALASLAPAPDEEHRDLCARASLQTRSVRADSAGLDAQIERRRDDTARQLYQRILRQGDEIPRLINQALGDARARSPAARSQQTPPFSEDFVRMALRDGGAGRAAPAGPPGAARSVPLTAEDVQLARMQGALQFVGFMLSPRHHNLRTYIRKNAEQSAGLPLSGCFAAMVDFNHWLDCPAKASHLEDQVRVHAQLALLSRGFLMPLVAYNPWVDILDNDASIKLVKRALLELGCVGVKLYPPMGFYPYDNVSLPLVTAEKRPDVELLDRKLRALYELCDDLGVPVMAHANESNGRDHAHDALAGARGWAALRDQVPTLKALRVNAGHFGGALDNTSGDWSSDFVKLMGEPGPLQVYGDLGYWDELLDNTTVQRKLERLLRVPLTSGGTAADRVMYGSDWLMLSKEPGWETYGQRVAAIVRGLDRSGDIARQVLGGNVLQCYGLGMPDGRGALQRLQKFHTDNGSAGPGWLQASPA